MLIAHGRLVLKTVKPMTSRSSDRQDLPVLTQAQRDAVPQLRWVDGYSRALDTKFRVPGTNIRFGADFLLGLVPGAGDMLSLALSGILILTMAKHGASFRLVMRMLGNVALDAIVGIVPVLGNVFDLFYKANYRNLELIREYYDEGKHTGSPWPVILGVLAVLGTIAVVVLATVAWSINWLWNLIAPVS